MDSRNPGHPVNRSGFALILVILMGLILSVAALGMVTVGTREGLIAGATARRAQARILAEAGARSVFHGWSTRAFAELDLGEESPVDTDGPAQATVQRIDSTLFLIRAEARVPPESAMGAVARAGLLARVFDPARTGRSFPAAATVDGPADLQGGVIDGRDPCGSGRDAPGVVATAVVAEADAVVEGSPPVLLGAAPAPPAPDPLTAPIAGAIATITIAGGTVAPRPLTRNGRCAQDHRNWGAITPDHPCHALLPVVLVPHDLTITGGSSHAVVVAEGDLHVEDGARLHGLVLVRGTLTVQAGASIQGAARAGRLVLRGGSIRADPCTVDAALSAPALDAAYRPGGRWWIPMF